MALITHPLTILVFFFFQIIETTVRYIHEAAKIVLLVAVAIDRRIRVRIRGIYATLLQSCAVIIQPVERLG